MSYVCMYARMYIRTYVSAKVDACNHVLKILFVSAYTHTCVYIYIHLYYIHTHWGIYKRKQGERYLLKCVGVDMLVHACETSNRTAGSRTAASLRLSSVSAYPPGPRVSRDTLSMCSFGLIQGLG